MLIIQNISHIICKVMTSFSYLVSDEVKQNHNEVLFPFPGHFVVYHWPTTVGRFHSNSTYFPSTTSRWGTLMNKIFFLLCANMLAHISVYLILRK